jgi:alkylation response protein AidB-like acyl-CoA dehydrogenase
MNLDNAVMTAREVGQSIVRDEAVEVDRVGRWPEGGLRAMMAAGLGGLVVPTDSGGLGLGMSGLLRVCEAIGSECGSTALCFGMHSVGAAVISAKATPDQRERYLEPISSGRHITTLALSEPGSGVHFHYPMLRIRNGGDGYVISGSKSFVTNGGHADSYVVSGIADGVDPIAGQFSCVLVPSDCKGMTWKNQWDGVGMRGNSSRTLQLDEVAVPADDRLGQEGDQLWYVFHVVAPYFLVAMTGSYLGVATAALDEAVRHVSKRNYEHSGESLGAAPVVQHTLGRLWAKVERSRQLAYAAAEIADRGDEAALLTVISAKAEMADCAVEVSNEAMTLMGGSAYTGASRIFRLLRDARAAHIMAPTTDILRIWAGRCLLGKPLLD